MSRTQNPAQLLADAFAAHVVMWAKERNANETAQKWLAHLACRLSLAIAAGHVCLPLESEPDFDRLPSIETLRDILLASGLVGTPEAPQNLPLVLDGENRLYLHRYFAYERSLAARLLSLKSRERTDTAAILPQLDAFFGTGTADVNWQRLAAALALRGQLTIISGGPGTGKTTTVANILACLLSQNPAARIMLAAPTGKAAMRMLEAIRAQTARFPEAIQSRMPQEAFTLHRLLGITSKPGAFRHHRDNPLVLDALVVDEASMIDLAMASRLLDALPSHARLIMLGDKDQLSAVEAGAVFSELSSDPTLTLDCIADLSAMTGIAKDAIIPPRPRSSFGLADSTVWLTQNYRFADDSGISRLALAIRDGLVMEARAVLEAAPDGSVTWLSRAATPTLPEAVKNSLQENHAAYLAAVTTQQEDKQAVFDAFERFRVLCAVREGTCGVSAVNTLMSAHFRRETGIAAREEWYIGRPVMVLQNDYALRLFNGDIGIALPNASGTLMVFFPSDAGGFRAIAPVRLPEHETAFAMTVHKSQGSEFESLLILMPPSHSPLITRELLYTAVTRAKKQVLFASSEDVLESGILASVRKHSGLMARVREQGG